MARQRAERRKRRQYGLGDAHYCSFDGGVDWMAIVESTSSTGQVRKSPDLEACGIVSARKLTSRRHRIPCATHAATWLMQKGINPWEAAGHLGMSVEILQKIYAKHSPDFKKWRPRPEDGPISVPFPCQRAEKCQELWYFYRGIILA